MSPGWQSHPKLRLTGADGCLDSFWTPQQLPTRTFQVVSSSSGPGSVKSLLRWMLWFEHIPETGWIRDVEHAAPCGAEPPATGTASSTAKVARASRLAGGDHAKQGRKSGSSWWRSPTDSQPWKPTPEDRPKEVPPGVLVKSLKCSLRLCSSPKVTFGEQVHSQPGKQPRAPGSEWLLSMTPGGILVKGEGLRHPPPPSQDRVMLRTNPRIVSYWC